MIFLTLLEIFSLCIFLLLKVFEKTNGKASFFFISKLFLDITNLSDHWQDFYRIISYAVHYIMTVSAWWMAHDLTLKQKQHFVVFFFFALSSIEKC